MAEKPARKPTPGTPAELVYAANDASRRGSSAVSCGRRGAARRRRSALRALREPQGREGALLARRRRCRARHQDHPEGAGRRQRDPRDALHRRDGGAGPRHRTHRRRRRPAPARAHRGPRLAHGRDRVVRQDRRLPPSLHARSFTSRRSGAGRRPSRPSSSRRRCRSCRPTCRSAAWCRSSGT